MSSAEDFYSSAAPAAAYTATPPPNLHKAEPPPPPPPKPGSHEASRQSTPAQTGPPLPPIPLQGNYSPVPGSPASSTPAPLPHPAQYHHSQPYRQTPRPTDPEIPPPAVSDNWLPETVLNKNTTDIVPILSDLNLLSALAISHPSFASSQKPLSNQLSANLALNDRVRDTASHLVQLRDQTQTLLLQHSNLSTQWRKKQTEMDKALEPWSPKSMYQRLVAGITEQEAIVRAVEESFLEGSSRSSGFGEEDFYGTGNGMSAGAGKANDREIGEWVKRIRDEVQTLEMRKEMRERWDEGRVGGWR